MKTDTYSFYGIDENFQKHSLFSCEKEKRGEAKLLMPPINKEYLFIISEYRYIVYPYDDMSLNGRFYSSYKLLDFGLNEKFIFLRNYRLSPKIKQSWSGRMDNKYIKYDLEDTNTGEQIILKSSNYGDYVDSVIDGLTYGLTPQVLNRLNDFKIN
jgi:hypothetical protein